MTVKMRTPSVLMTSFSTTSTPSILPQNLTINSSEQPSAYRNSSCWPPVQTPDLSMSCFTMIFGAISNLTALGILARVQYRRKSGAPFLWLTVALLLADLGGHLIPGAFALYRHIDLRYKTQCGQSNKEFCHIFGASMVFFGLCPLLLGCAMAVERYVAISQPFFHAAMITVAHVWRIVLFLSSFALVLAVLPLFSVGTYTDQFPGTWCFLPVHRSNSTIADTSLVLSFSSLGLAALTLSVLCNLLSGLTLLHARRKSSNINTKSAACRNRPASSTSFTSLFCSLDVEMMVQLAVITAASCVCWSPFLIHRLVMHFNQGNGPSEPEKEFMLMSLQMATWNQIFDPWVYIILRRAVLFKLCPAIYTRPTSTGISSCADTRSRRALSVQ